jgi:hypothetical protein
MPMEIGISFSCPKKSAPAQPAPHADKLRPSAFTVRLAARHSPPLSPKPCFFVKLFDD